MRDRRRSRAARVVIPTLEPAVGDDVTSICGLMKGKVTSIAPDIEKFTVRYTLANGAHCDFEYRFDQFGLMGEEEE